MWPIKGPSCASAMGMTSPHVWGKAARHGAHVARDGHCLLSLNNILLGFCSKSIVRNLCDGACVDRDNPKSTMLPNTYVSFPNKCSSEPESSTLRVVRM